MPVSSRLSIVAIEADPLVIRALGEDLGRAHVRRAGPLREGAAPPGGPRPDVVVLGASRVDASTQRRLVYRAWGPSVVVVEVADASPVARVWRTPAVVHPVELGPRFLAPFLVPPATPARAASPAVSALRCLGYGGVAVNLLLASRSGHPAVALLWLAAFLFLVATLARETRAGRRRQGDGAAG